MPQQAHNKPKRDQFVIACLADTATAPTVMGYARHLAAALNKGVIALYIADPDRRAMSAAEAETELKRLGLPYVVLCGKTRKIVPELPEMLGAVLMVAAVDPAAPRHSALNPRTLLSDFAGCRTAYLTVQRPMADGETLRRVALSVDFRRESKEKLLWASYFARFNGSSIEVCYRDYRDEGLRQKWYNNMLFLNKFFANLGLAFTPRIVAGRSPRVDLDLIGQYSPDLLISLTTDLRERDVVDVIVGPQESRVICNSAQTPVLFLNPRDDLYVLCD